MTDILQAKLVKRGVSLKGLDLRPQRECPRSNGETKNHPPAGHPHRKSQSHRPANQESKKKVQASIQGDIVRVSGKDRDSLQEIIALLKQQDFGIDMQFTNYRSN